MEPASNAGVVATGAIQASREREPIATGDRGEVLEVTVTVGPETYTPIKFQSVTVGAITGRAMVQPGETVEDAIAKLRARLTTAFKGAFAVTMREHLERVHESVEIAKSRGRE